MCVCTSPTSSRAYCDCCKGENTVHVYHRLRFELLCRLYGKREGIGDFTREEIESVRDLMAEVELFGNYRIREAQNYRAPVVESADTSGLNPDS